MPIHRELKLAELHAVDAFKFTNAAARVTAPVTAADVGKIARQVDNESIWMLVEATPPVWEELTSTSLEALVVQKTRRIIAGKGLTGDGDLTTDRTIAIGAPPDGSLVVEDDWVGVGVINDSQHGERGAGLLHPVATQSTPGFMSAADKTKLDAAADAPYVLVQCDETILVGDLVVLPPNGIVIRASALEPNLVPVLGVVIAKPSSTTAHVQSTGVVEVFSDLTRGQHYFVGTYGLNPLPPTSAPGRKLYTQKVGIALSPTELLLNISPDVVSYYSP